MLTTAQSAERLAKSADEFNLQLEALVVAVHGDLGQIVRATVLKLFRKIVFNSPVDTGTYRASHGIRNGDPGDDKAANVEYPAGTKNGSSAPATSRARSWFWEPGMGPIYIFNNLPYAERIELGWSSQKAPDGVYAKSMSEFDSIWNEELAKYKGKGYQ
jgi:hypothetical protein